MHDAILVAEQAAVSAAEAVQQAEKQLGGLYDELGACDNQAEAALLGMENEEVAAALRRAAANLKAAQGQAEAMADELTARTADVEKSLDRRWYKFNPPANAAIDLQEKRSGCFAQGINGYKLAMVTIIGSFAGVVVELLWCLLTNGYIESRSGLVWGPFNLLYGVGAAVLTLLLYRYRNRGKWLSFLGGVIIGSVVEYACHWFQETVFGATSWDYSHLPFNLNGRITLLYSLFWGVLGVWWIKDVYPRLSKWIMHLPQRFGKIITWAMAIFLVVNTLVSGAAVLRWGQRQEGLPARNAIETTLDQRFPDERLEKIYANMVFE